MPSLPNEFILTGTYTVKKKTDTTRQTLIVPAVQTCVLTILESAHGIAVAHIDSILIVSNTISAMIKELQQMGKGTITARLYGGDCNFRSIIAREAKARGSNNPIADFHTSIYEPIYQELNKRKIPYSHKDYHLSCGFVMAVIATIWAVSSLGPESRLIALMCILMAYKATEVLQNILPEKWQPGFFSRNIDVTINVSTDPLVDVKLVKNNETNSAALLENARKKIVAEGQQKLGHAIIDRSNLNPTDPKNTTALAMIRI